MLSGFPQLDSLLKKRGGINEAAQQQQPDQFQQMPTQQQPQVMTGGYAQQPAMQIPQAQPDARPLGGFSSGMVKQRAFNQAQQNMNGGMPGGKFNKRRF